MLDLTEWFVGIASLLLLITPLLSISVLLLHQVAQLGLEKLDWHLRVVERSYEGVQHLNNTLIGSHVAKAALQQVKKDRIFLLKVCKRSL